MEVFKLIKSDLFRYHGTLGFKSFIYAFFMIEGFRYTFFMRLKNSVDKKNPMYWIYYIFVRHYSYKFGFQIFTKNIGKGFYIGHFGQLIINGQAEIGNNVNVSPGVVIGQVSRGKNKGVPKIGNNVWIGTNAILVGNIVIGDNVLIAPGAYVYFNVPAYSVVKGNPGEIRDSKGVEGYICNSWNE